MADLFKELVYEKVITVLNLSNVVFKGGYLIGLYQNGIPYVVDSSSSNEFAYERTEVVPVSEELSNETPSVHLADRSDYYMQYQIFFRTTNGTAVKTALKEFRDYFFANKQHTIGGYKVSFKTSRGDKQATVPVQSGNFYSFFKINVYLTAIKNGYIWKDTDNWKVRLYATSAIVAGSFLVGATYKIVSTGSTDFTLIGAENSDVDTIFTATGVGSGTGTATQEYETLKLDIDVFATSGNPLFSNKTAVATGIISNTTSNSKLRIFYNEQFMEDKIYSWIMNKLDKDTVFQFLHTFSGDTFTYQSFLTGGARTRTDNGIAILEFDWIEADI